MSDKAAERKDIAHETEICCNLATHNFTGERKLGPSSVDPQLSMLCFY